MGNIRTESQLVREALVLEIRDATRWSAVMDAWHALLSVKRKADALIQEQERLHGDMEPTSEPHGKRSPLSITDPTPKKVAP